MTTLIIAIIGIVLFLWLPLAVIFGALGLWIGGTIGCVIGAGIGFVLQAAS
jgi:hypothetical protein